MSWIDELSPMLPTPGHLVDDLRNCWADYAEEALPMPTRVAFCTLRVGQRVAYWAGWRAGGRIIWRPR